MHGFPASRLPKGPHLERVPDEPQSSWLSSSQSACWVDFLAGSKALLWSCFLIVYLPWHPAPQLHLCSGCQVSGFQNKSGCVLGAHFAYKAVHTCPCHHCACLDHPPPPPFWWPEMLVAQLGLGCPLLWDIFLSHYAVSSAPLTPEAGVLGESLL